MRDSEGAIVQVQGGQGLTVAEVEMRCRKGAFFRPCCPRIYSLGSRAMRPDQTGEEKNGNPKCGLCGKEMWGHANLQSKLVGCALRRWRFLARRFELMLVVNLIRHAALPDVCGSHNP
jgi:hypothetical protein